MYSHLCLLSVVFALCELPQLILYRVHDIPFPVLMSHIHFRFFLILLVTFEVSSHKLSYIPNYINLDFGYGLAFNFGLDHMQLVNCGNVHLLLLYSVHPSF